MEKINNSYSTEKEDAEQTVDREKIASAFTLYGFGEFTDFTTTDKFLTFAKRLRQENEKYNLTAITEISEVIVKHYIDSLSALKFFKFENNKKIIDIGTGAGFPSLPILFARDDLKFTMLDSTEKKTAFINETLKIMGTPAENSAICERAELLATETNYREQYDYAVSRAVSRFNVLVELCVPFVKNGGYFIAYKGKDGEKELKETGKPALEKLGCEIFDVIPFNIEDENLKRLESCNEKANRTLIIVKKVKNTPKLYPRKYNVIIKSPL